VHLLETLRRTYSLALVSNFDDSTAAFDVLRRGAVHHLFHARVISVDHGWRKPRASIFEHALAALSVSPSEALFVGDSAEEDVVGARRLGMDAVWVNASDRLFPDQLPAPTYVVRSIPALLDILGPEN
jgi:putative hydrolase of the HAD superfamily